MLFPIVMLFLAPAVPQTFLASSRPGNPKWTERALFVIKLPQWYWHLMISSPWVSSIFSPHSDFDHLFSHYVYNHIAPPLRTKFNVSGHIRGRSHCGRPRLGRYRGPSYSSPGTESISACQLFLPQPERLHIGRSQELCTTPKHKALCFAVGCWLCLLWTGCIS